MKYEVQLGMIKMVIEADSKEEALRIAREYSDKVKLTDIKEKQWVTKRTVRKNLKKK